MEEYLTKSKTKSRIVFTKLRANNNRLPLITGRYQNIPREERLCNKCDSSIVGDEYHAILECTNETIRRMRQRYIPEYYRTWPNRLKFCSLMQCNNVHILNKFVYFLDEIFKMFR